MSIIIFYSAARDALRSAARGEVGETGGEKKRSGAQRSSAPGDVWGENTGAQRSAAPGRGASVEEKRSRAQRSAAQRATRLKRIRKKAAQSSAAQRCQVHGLKKKLID